MYKVQGPITLINIFPYYTIALYIHRHRRIMSPNYRWPVGGLVGHEAVGSVEVPIIRHTPYHDLNPQPLGLPVFVNELETARLDILTRYVLVQIIPDVCISQAELHPCV
jgi:hypothetical protein